MTYGQIVGGRAAGMCQVKRGLTFRTLLASALLAVLVVGGFGLMTFAVQKLRDAATNAVHAAQTLSTANRLEHSVLDLETGLRGYQITGQPRFLQPYQLALRQYPDLGRRLLLTGSRHSGYEVVAAHDGEEALQAARDRNPDLAVLDVMMPKVDGFELTRKLRDELPTRWMPISLLTARTQETGVTSGFDVGADDYLRKPFNPDELVARVRAVLGRL
jgi:CheY-like chemotaxis protein